MKKKRQKVKIRTWYGLDVVAEVEPGCWHRAGFGRLVIPHPPVVNWLLRYGLSPQTNRHLSILHEIGHLQMLPLELLYAAILFSVSISNGHTKFYEVILTLMSFFAIWEMFAESYTIKRNTNYYGVRYKDVSLIPRILFWAGTTTLVSIGWVVALR